MDVLFEAVANKLEKGVPELRWIDWEAGQIDMQEDEYPFQFPCCFIDIANIQWGNIGEHLQTGDTDINIRIVFDVYEDFHNLSPNRKQALERLHLMNKIHHCLQSFSGEHFNQLNRVQTYTEKRADGYKCINLVYRTNIRDNYGMRQYQEKQVEPVVMMAVTK